MQEAQRIIFDSKNTVTSTTFLVDKKALRVNTSVTNSSEMES